jgi:thiosulfate/3-mercaptopyruvate sulfurtransferase
MNREELLIEAEELATKLGSPGLRIYDATFVLRPDTSDTGQSLYDRGHIPGAVFLDHASISDTTSGLNFTLPTPQELASKLGAVGISSDSEVVVYSTDSIMWATRIWWVLRYAGHNNVRVLNGGLAAWQGDIETAANTYEPASFSIDPKPQMFASIDEVEAAMSDGAVCTLNALPWSFYTGEADIDYAKQGHITASESLPFSNLMDGHYIKSTDALAAEFSNFRQQDRLINYCGGGIAATLNATCALLAGIDNVAVYDGSMSEWLQAGKPTTPGSEPGSI